jgi:hypothetical protein
MMSRVDPFSGRFWHNAGMNDQNADVRPREDPTAQLEQALIEEFIRQRGYDPAALHELPHGEREDLLKHAAAHASAKLAEMESRAHFVHELHGDR